MKEWIVNEMVMNQEKGEENERRFEKEIDRRRERWKKRKKKIVFQNKRRKSYGNEGHFSWTKVNK